MFDSNYFKERQCLWWYPYLVQMHIDLTKDTICNHFISCFSTSVSVYQFFILFCFNHQWCCQLTNVALIGFNIQHSDAVVNICVFKLEEDVIFFLFIIAVTLIQFCRFEVPNSITHHPYVVLHVHHPKSSLRPSLVIPAIPFSTSLPALPLWLLPHYKYMFLSLLPYKIKRLKLSRLRNCGFFSPEI